MVLDMDPEEAAQQERQIKENEARLSELRKRVAELQARPKGRGGRAPEISSGSAPPKQKKQPKTVASPPSEPIPESIDQPATDEPPPVPEEPAKDEPPPAAEPTTKDDVTEIPLIGGEFTEDATPLPDDEADE
jgi:hypothetical protein